MDIITGYGLELVARSIFFPSGERVPFRVHLGCTGRPGGWNGGGFGSHEGGQGGRAGDITFVGAFEPELVHDPEESLVVSGWDMHDSFEFRSMEPIGVRDIYNGSLPAKGGGRYTAPLLSVSAIGGSGGFPGGSLTVSPGDFGAQGDDGEITGL